MLMNVQPIQLCVEMVHVLILLEVIHATVHQVIGLVAEHVLVGCYSLI